MPESLTIKEHKAVLDQYRPNTFNGWHAIPDDGYLYNHLAYHLKGAELFEELHQLFEDDQWLRVRVPQSNFLYDAYLEDLQIAWEVAYEQCLDQINNHESPTALIDCFRYVLIRTSINSISADYPPELVARAVELEIWTVERALSVLKQSPHINLELFAALLKTGKLNKDQQKYLIDIAYERVIKRRDHWHEEEVPWWPPSPTVAGFLSELEIMLPFFSDEQREEVLDFDYKWLFGYGWGKPRWHSGVLNSVAPYMSSEQIQELIALSDEAIYKRSIPRIIKILARYVGKAQQQELGQKAYLLALQGQLERDIARDIALVVPLLPSEMRPKAIEMGLKAIRTGEPDPWKLPTLLDYIDLISESEKPEFVNSIFETFKEVDWGYGRATNFANLYPHLNDVQKADAFEIIINMPSNTGERLPEILKNLYAHLDENQRERALNAAFAGAMDTQYKHEEAPQYRLFALLPLIQYLDTSFIKKCLNIALDIGDEDNYTQAVARVIAVLSTEQRTPFIRWVFDHRHDSRVSQSPTFYAQMLRIIGDYLPDEVREIVYQEAMQESYGEPIDRLVHILSYLDEAHSQEVLEKVLTHRHKYMSAPLEIELSRLAPALKGQAQNTAVQLALETIQKSQPHHAPNPKKEEYIDQSNRENRSLHDLGIAQNIKRIADYLSPVQLTIAYTIMTQQVKTTLCQAEGLVALIPHLTGKKLETGLQLCYEETKRNNFRPIREDLLSPIAPFLTQQMQKEVLDFASKDSDMTNGLHIVLRIAEHLDVDLNEHALDWAFKRASIMVNFDNQRPVILSKLAMLLDEPRKSQSIQKALADILEDNSTDFWGIRRRFTILSRLANISPDHEHIRKMIRQTLLEYLSEFLDDSRSILIDSVPFVLYELSPSHFPPEIHEGVAKQIMDVCEEWAWI